MKNSFIQFPNYLVWNYKKSTDTLIHEYGDKILHILSYLDGGVTRLEDVTFSIENMIVSCGYIPKSGKGNINDQFRSIIIDLVSKGILEVKNNKDISTCKITDFVRCEYIPFAEKDKLKGFFPVKHDNYLKIVNDDTKLNKLTLLKIYYYILARLNRRKDDKLKDVSATGGKAEVFWDSFYNICKDLDINDNTLTKYLEYLKELELICYGNIGMVQKNDVQSTANNVYAVDKAELKEGLNQSKLWHEDNGYILLKNKDIKKLSRINGYKGKIVSETNRGKDVTKLENELSKLKNKSKKYTIAELKGIINTRYKNILEIDEIFKLDLSIECSWKDYLATDVTDYTVEDYKKVLSEIEDIEKEMNKRLNVN